MDIGRSAYRPGYDAYAYAPGYVHTPRFQVGIGFGRGYPWWGWY
jgi:hypothetical protein